MPTHSLAHGATSGAAFTWAMSSEAFLREYARRRPHAFAAAKPVHTTHHYRWCRLCTVLALMAVEDAPLLVQLRLAPSDGKRSHESRIDEWGPACQHILQTTASALAGYRRQPRAWWRFTGTAADAQTALDACRGSTPPDQKERPLCSARPDLLAKLANRTWLQVQKQREARTCESPPEYLPTASARAFSHRLERHTCCLQLAGATVCKPLTETEMSTAASSYRLMLETPGDNEFSGPVLHRALAHGAVLVQTDVTASFAQVGRRAPLECHLSALGAADTPSAI